MEEFSLPESELKGKSVDLYINMTVFDGDGRLGSVGGFTSTPEYLLLEVVGKEELFVPFTDHFVRIEDDGIHLLRKL